LKLGEDKEVLAALKGMTELTYAEILEVYGAPVPRFEPINWPKVTSLPGSPGPNFYTLQTFWLACKAPQIMVGVELILEGKIQKTYQ